MIKSGLVKAKYLWSMSQMKRETRLRKRVKVVTRWVFALLFFTLTILIAYGQRDSSAFYMRQSLYHSVVNGTALGQKSQPFEKIQTAHDYWRWSKLVLLPTLYSMGSEDTDQFLLIGRPRLRQLRVNASDGDCDYEDVNDKKYCETGYSEETEDKTQYLWGWEPMPEYYSLEQTKGYRYYMAASLGENGEFHGKFATYSGGGYVVDLTGDYASDVFQVQELEEAEWIDAYTRAVFLECVVFSVQSRLVYVVTLLAEMAPTGSFFPSVEMKLLSMYSKDDSLTDMIFIIALAAIIVLMIFLKLTRAMDQGHKYLKDFSHVVDAICMAVSLAVIALYFFYGMMLQEAKTQPKNIYMLRNSSYMEEQYVITLAVLVFCASLKIMNMFSTLGYFKVLLAVCRATVKQVLKSTLMFVFVFFTFVHAGFMLYNETDEELYTLDSAFQTILFYPLGGSRQMDSQKKSAGVDILFMFYVVLQGMMVFLVFYTVTMHTYSPTKLLFPAKDFADTGEMSAACKRYLKKLARWGRVQRMREQMARQMRRMRHRRNQLVLPSPLPKLERHNKQLDRMLRNTLQENQLLFQNLDAVRDEMKRQVFGKR
ncbi:polycystin-2-like protein 1 [Ptychodera flava]|uniref:polycystin-2-like protein 1 n=1 Tax=Ptychodera flava TaxID=63121 RepID=UPI00396A3C23